MSKKDAKKQVKQVEETKSKVNFEELIINNITNFRLVQDNSGYHYTQLNLSQKNLDGLSNTFNNYKYLEQIDLSENNLIDFSALSQMPFLIRLNLKQNNIKDIKCLANEESFKSLKHINLQSNKLVELSAIKVPLQVILLNDNKIEKMESFDGHPKLRQIFLKRNKIQTLTQFQNLPEIKELNLKENRIKSIAGLELMQSLQVLKISHNMIDSFDETFPAVENLQYLDIRKNKIDKFDDILKLQTLPNLRTIMYKDNPFEAKNANYLLDTVNAMLKLNKINNVFVTKQLKLKAFHFLEEKYQKEQELKRIQEEEERAKEQAAVQD